MKGRSLLSTSCTTQAVRWDGIRRRGVDVVAHQQRTHCHFPERRKRDPKCLCSENESDYKDSTFNNPFGERASGGAMSTFLASVLAFTFSTGSIPSLNIAMAESRGDTSVLETSTIKLSEEIKGPASIVKDCRTDSPDLQSVYWVSARSVGQNPTLYAVNKEGKLIGDEYEVQARNVGQEEIVFVHRTRKNKAEDFIVLADTSNKFKNRDQLKFYEIIPDVPSTQLQEKSKNKIEVQRQIDFAFPRPATPASDSAPSSSYKIPIGPQAPVEIQYPQEDYETAAIIVVNDTLWIFSKRSLGSSTALYRLPLDTISPFARADDSNPYTLEYIQEFNSGAPACGADVSSDGTRLAVMTRETIFLFDITTEAAKANPLSNLITRIPAPKASGAPIGLTWDDPRTMLVLNDKNEVTKITLSS